MFFASNTEASEIFGKISTDPNALSTFTNNPPTPGETNEQPNASTVGPEITNQIGGAVILPLNQNAVISKTEEDRTVNSEVKVLGLSLYPDGTLLRGTDHKIYLIQSQMKKYIPNLKELAKFRGRAILPATTEELSQYQARGHLIGELIRQKGEVKVYEITTGGKHHILNLTELREHYFGLEIFNISAEEMMY